MENSKISLDKRLKIWYDSGMSSDKKVCSICNLEKSTKEFSKQNDHKDGLRSCCNLCNKICRSDLWVDGKKYYHEHKKDYYKYNLKNRYGITLEQYDEMFEEQDGNCAICGLPELMKRLSVDHNHNTGEVRGLLCAKCNRFLGFANDDTKLLQNAIEYLGREVYVVRDS